MALQNELQNLNQLSSDHNPIQLIIHGQSTTSPWSNPKKATNWKKFAADLHTAIPNANPNIININKLEETIDHLTPKIQKIVTENKIYQQVFRQKSQRKEG